MAPESLPLTGVAVGESPSRSFDTAYPRPERRRHDVMSCATETLEAPTLAQFLVSVAGSVTAALAAYSGEAIEVAKLDQRFELCGAGDAPLGLGGEELVLRRRVLLR